VFAYTDSLLTPLGEGVYSINAEENELVKKQVKVAGTDEL